MTPVVDVTGLTAIAGDAVLLDGVDFQVWPGQVTALVGASGSGKTTAALALLGDHGPEVRLGGRVEVADTLVVDADGPTEAGTAVRGQVVAFLPQHPGSALNPARRIGAGLTELARLHHRGQPAGDIVDAALRAAQLPVGGTVLRRFPHQFSGGERQRIALAQALTCGPRVLVLDEPSTGLDSVTRLHLVKELTELARQGLGILLLSHDLDLVHALADHVVVLGAGRVIGAGTTDVLPTRNPVPLDRKVLDNAEPLLEATALSASLRPRGRSPILRDLDLTVAPGRCLGVVGRSGSGKTTLARCLAGLHERYAGRITLAGQHLPVLRKRSAEQTRRVQYVWQEVRGSFDDRRPVCDQVARTAERLRGSGRTAARAEAIELLGRLGVSAETAARSPALLSGGELQRAALARALLARPDVLICDEITTALDDGGTRLVVEVLGELAAGGTALVWISHDLGLVAAVADHVLVLEAGRVVEQGPPVAVMTDPKSATAAQLAQAAGIARLPAAVRSDEPGEPRRSTAMTVSER